MATTRDQREHAGSLGNWEDVISVNEYLKRTNEYYSDTQLSYPLYSTPYPNPEETDRYAAIVRYLSLIRLHCASQDVTPRILDLGCGRGWLTNLMTPFGTCEGVEPAPGAVEYARKQFSGLTFRIGTLADLLDSPDFKPFDLIVSSEVIEHVPWEHKQTFVQQIAQALTLGGSCVITTPRGELYGQWKRNRWPAQPIEEWLTEKKLRTIFEEHGFQVIHHMRAHSVQFLTVNRLLSDWRLQKVLDILGSRFLIPALEYMGGFYQVWWFKKQ